MVSLTTPYPLPDNPQLKLGVDVKYSADFGGHPSLRGTRSLGGLHRQQPPSYIVRFLSSPLTYEWPGAEPNWRPALARTIEELIR